MSNAYIVVGSTGTGKSTFVKNRLEKVNPKSIFVHDVNNEYSYLNYSNQNEGLKKADDFLNLTTKVSNGVIVFEEATIYLGTKMSKETLRDILVRKRHTNNTIFLVFHALRFVPYEIFNLCTHLVFHKTNDSTKLVQSRFEDEELTKIFEHVKNDPDKYFEYIYEIY